MDIFCGYDREMLVRTGGQGGLLAVAGVAGVFLPENGKKLFMAPGLWQN